MEREKSVGVSVLGWLLIIYFIYTFVYPIAYVIWSLIATGIDKPSESPIGTYNLLKAAGVNCILLSILGISSIIYFAVSISSLIGGIGVLKLKKWARKFVVTVFSVSIISLMASFCIQLFEPKLARVMLAKKFGLLAYAIFIPLNILIIYFFQRPKIKEEFENN